jgi:hypothetical protein
MVSIPAIVAAGRVAGLAERAANTRNKAPMESETHSGP